MSIKKLTEAANKYSDGHYTIMKFTTNYRVDLSTVSDRLDIPIMAGEGDTLNQAISNCLSFTKNLQRELI